MSYRIGDYFVIENREEFDERWDKEIYRFNDCNLTLKTGYVGMWAKNREEKINSIVFPLILKVSYSDPRCCGDYVEVSKEELIKEVENQHKYALEQAERLCDFAQELKKEDS